MRNITVLGSTGSIGRSTLDVISRNRESFRVVALTAGSNIKLLESQIRQFKPGIVAVADAKTAGELAKKVRKIDILSGPDGISQVAAYAGSDFVISSIVGAAGLMPTVAAIKAGKNIGLANKEALVMAGELVMKIAARKKVRVIPVDSEHSAVFQCIGNHTPDQIHRIILTASGGPFVNRTLKDLKNITAQDALKHPNWSMGRKISIDSATLMNKGLEVIEACRLFNMPAGKVDVLVHPQSIVHSLVEFSDRSCLAQMSVPDMRGPIAYALSYPLRVKDPIPALRLDQIRTLTFSVPDLKTFPCLSYAYLALAEGGTMPCVLNAANEVAVHAFLHGRIGFTHIPAVIRKTIDGHEAVPASSLGRILEADRWARETAEKYISRLRK
ncbi:MAG: 1-deoxy-D-xylulose-5-phosphate reductoisomerase [Nitrospiraceae bacterium]|nr:1-deoxy-D-xylulose-5-phosphate reductoisomerase [Nitrospiraceae bacterium]